MPVNPLVVFVGLSVVTLGGLVAVVQQRNPAKLPVPAVVQAPASTAKTEMQSRPLVVPESKTVQAVTPEKTTVAETPVAKPPVPTPPVEKTVEKSGEKLASLEPGPKVVEKPKPAPEAAKEITKPEPDTVPDTAKVPIAPIFDMVRVEKDGGAVVVGRAAPGADVLLKMNGKTIGKTRANKKGDWVFVPEQLIPQGSNELIIEATGKDKKTVRSKQSVFIAIPKGAQEKPLIVVAKPDAPTKVLQQPEAMPGAGKVSPTKTTGSPAEKTGKKPVKKLASLPKPPEQPKTAEPTESLKVPEPARLTFGTVDYNDDGEIVFTGKATPDSTVRLYVDNIFVGDAAVGPEGDWVFRGKKQIRPGEHELRADLLTANGKVARRAAVPFVRANPKKVAALLETRKKVSPPEPQPAKPVVVVPVTTPEQVEQPQVAEASPEVKKPVEQPEQKVLAEAQIAAQPSPVPTPPVEKTPAVAAKATPVATPEPKDQQVSVAVVPPAPTPAPVVVETAETEPVDKKPNPTGPDLVSQVVIQPGNNLWNISRVIYGRGIAYTTIYQANLDQIKNPHKIYPGQIFTTPGAMSTGSIAPEQREPLAGVVDNKTAEN